MRDIYHRPAEEASPDRPPRPRAPKRARTFKRKAIATVLGVLLAVAAIAATVGTVVSKVNGVSGSSFFPNSPFGLISTTISDAYRKLMGFAGGSIQLLAIGRDFVTLVPDLLHGKRGDEFLALLQRASDQLDSMSEGSLVPELGARASDLGSAVSTLRTWLIAQPERHVAVVFANSAEMRAGGGFIGSYAEMTLKGGAVSGITVHDITEADSVSLDKTIPPIPLEPIADRWRAADANWFLSGPESGAAFLELLNRSPLYKDNKMDAVVFVSPRVVSNLLDITGPISAADVQVDSQNFLRVIQEEVQEGQAAGDDSPKAVLTALVPKFMEEAIGRVTAKPLDFLATVRGGITRRDIVVYAADANLERALGLLNVTGSLYPTNDTFVGGYVAVAPSTIGGDKTDAVTSEALRIREQLLPKGLVETRVEVERTHQGTKEDSWWYQEENRSYVKVYAPQGATPTAASGIWQRDRDTATYGSGFTTYAPLVASESTIRTYDAAAGADVFEETGKTVFGFWQRTARGSGTVASVTYARQLTQALEAGDTYTFVLERQPASTATYDVTLFAPPGLSWKDTGTNQYTFHSDDPDGRTVLSLELVTAN